MNLNGGINMKIKRLLAVVAIIGLLSCYGCGKAEVKPASGETSVSQETAGGASQASSAEASEEEGVNYSETEPEPDPEEMIDYGICCSEVVVTGIEDWNSVGSTIAGFTDGSLFSIEYEAADGTQISGSYTPGTPDQLTFEFNTATGAVVSATYYGYYNDPDDVAIAIEACDANSYLMGDDIIGLAAEGNYIVVAFDPKSARFNNTIRTYFLEGGQDPDGYINAVKKNFEGSSYSADTLKGDNYACDVIHGIKVTWYK